MDRYLCRTRGARRKCLRDTALCLLTKACSGAEGTIIEEQENLPQMIWGLEGEDKKNKDSRHRTDNAGYGAQHAASQNSRKQHLLTQAYDLCFCSLCQQHQLWHA